MGNTPTVEDNEEAWNWSQFPNCPVNPSVDPQSVPHLGTDDWKQSIPLLYGSTVVTSNQRHAYLRYAGYCWLYLATPDNVWATVGLFPRIKFKKLLKINPRYQIGGSDYKLSEITRQVINDTWTIYSIMPDSLISVVDLVPFQYKYSNQKQLENKLEIIHLLNNIAQNLDVLKSAREQCRDPLNDTSPFLSPEDGDALDWGISFMERYRLPVNLPSTSNCIEKSKHQFREI